MSRSEGNSRNDIQEITFGQEIQRQEQLPAENTAHLLKRMNKIEMDLEYQNVNNMNAHEDETISTKLLIKEKANLKNAWLSKTQKEQSQVTNLSGRLQFAQQCFNFARRKQQQIRERCNDTEKRLTKLLEVMNSCLTRNDQINCKFFRESYEKCQKQFEQVKLKCYEAETACQKAQKAYNALLIAYQNQMKRYNKVKTLANMI